MYHGQLLIFWLEPPLNFVQRFHDWLTREGLNLSPFHQVSYDRGAIESAQPYESAFEQYIPLQTFETLQNSTQPIDSPPTGDVFYKNTDIQFQILDASKQLLSNISLSRLSTLVTNVTSVVPALYIIFSLNTQQKEFVYFASRVNRNTPYRIFLEGTAKCC